MFHKQMRITHWTFCVVFYLLVPSTPAFRCSRNKCHHVASRTLGPGILSLVSASVKPLVSRDQPKHQLGLESVDASSSTSCARATDSNGHTTSAAASAKDSAKESSTTLDSYHLLWSPHVRRKMLFTTPLLFLAKYAWTWSGMTLNAFQVRWVQNWILPLLASSCCLLQLALNVVSVGCSGFNSYLGPIRPYFLSLFLLLFTSDLSRKSIVWSTTLTRVTVVISPELVHLFNSWRSQRRVADLLQSTDITTTNLKDSTVANGPQAIRATVQLEIPTMGCVACINTIDGTLQRQTSLRAQVVRAASALHPLGRKGGSATVEVVAEGEQALTEMIRQLQEATDRIGFEGASVTSIRKVTSDKPSQTNEL